MDKNAKSRVISMAARWQVARLAVVLGAIVAILSFAACSDDSDSSPSPTQSPTGSSTGTPEPPPATPTLSSNTDEEMPVQRHEVPAHLNIEDKALAGLTMRQLMVAIIGLALAYSAMSEAPLPRVVVWRVRVSREAASRASIPGPRPPPSPHFHIEAIRNIALGRPHTGNQQQIPAGPGRRAQRLLRSGQGRRWLPQHPAHRGASSRCGRNGGLHPGQAQPVRVTSGESERERLPWGHHKGLRVCHRRQVVDATPEVQTLPAPRALRAFDRRARCGAERRSRAFRDLRRRRRTRRVPCPAIAGIRVRARRGEGRYHEEQPGEESMPHAQ